MTRNRRTWAAMLIIIVLAAGGATYYRYATPSQAQQAEESTVATAQATRGDLTITADGSGTLVPSDERELAFAAGGVLTELLVAVGDEVEAGEPVARVDDADAQQAWVSAQVQLLKAQLDVASAETHLLSVQEGPSDADLLAAEASLASAQEALASLQNGPDESQIEKLQLSLAQAKNSLWSAQLSRDAAGGGPDVAKYESAQVSVANAEISVRKAEMDLESLLEPATDAELADAKARVAQAIIALEDLQASPDVEDVTTAQAQLEQSRLSLAQAELNLASAREAMAQTTLVAPIDGTIMAVQADLGDKVGTNPVITLADLGQPQVLFWVEESDLKSVAPGNSVNVVLEALPDLTFSGHILSVDPALVTVSNTPAVQVWASMDLSSYPTQLLSGMNAEVEIVAGEARNAVLVPVGALRELGTGQYAVLVVGADGEMELRPVEVGLQDFVYAEITSGLDVGETISTGTVPASSSSSSSSPMPSVPANGMMRMLGG